MFKAVIESVESLPSVNDMYKVGRNSYGGSWIYLNPTVAKYKSLIKEKLIEQGVQEYFNKLENGKYVFKVNLIFMLNNNFWKRDVSNIIKATEDALTDATGHDDRYNVEVSSVKVMNDVSDFETVIICIEETELNEDELKFTRWVND